MTSKTENQEREVKVCYFFYKGEITKMWNMILPPRYSLHGMGKLEQVTGFFFHHNKLIDILNYVHDYFHKN